MHGKKVGQRSHTPKPQLITELLYPQGHELKMKFTKSLQEHGFKANQQQILSSENIKALKEWCKDMIKENDNIATATKFTELKKYLNILESVQKTISESHRREITLNVLSILKSLVTDKFFIVIFGNDIKKQVTAYELKTKSSRIIEDTVKELATEKELFKPNK